MFVLVLCHCCTAVKSQAVKSKLRNEEGEEEEVEEEEVVEEDEVQFERKARQFWKMFGAAGQSLFVMAQARAP